MRGETKKKDCEAAVLLHLQNQRRGPVASGSNPIQINCTFINYTAESIYIVIEKWNADDLFAARQARIEQMALVIKCKCLSKVSDLMHLSPQDYKSCGA